MLNSQKDIKFILKLKEMAKPFDYSVSAKIKSLNQTIIE